jgi:hypothetical protein
VRPVIVDYEIIRTLSDAAIIARSRATIVDVRTIIANSIDSIIEAKHLIRGFTDNLISIKQG